MSADPGDVPTVLVPDEGQFYLNGDRVDLAEGPDGRQQLTRSAGGKYLVLSCSQTDRDGVRLLRVSLFRRY